MIELHWNEAVYAEETAALRMLQIDGGTLVIGSDFSSASRTVSRIVEARRSGELVALYPMLADPLETAVEQVCGAIGAQTDPGAKFTQLLALRDNRLRVNERALSEAAQYDARTLAAAILAVKLADVLLFFTAAEKERWSTMLGRPVRRYAYLPVPSVHPACTAQNGIAVYAPHCSQARLAFVALALAERRMPANVVCAENSAAALNAGTVIVPSWWRPARAASLARAGYRVVTPSAGAPDDRCACTTYPALDAFALPAAVDAAQSGGCAPRFDVTADWTLHAIRAARCAIDRGPRVSVIVRTYDRPQLLARALRSIVAQTYADVEIVVVNNGGEEVHSIVEEACKPRPFRYRRLPQRMHISAASNAGARAASGTYIAYLDDDDLLYPDHLSRAVEALERSGADLAYTNCVAEYARMNGADKHVLGFQIFRDAEFVAMDLYVDNVAPIHSIVHRRELFDRAGYFDEDLPVTDDWEMWLRAARGARFIHVDRVTCEYSWRHDPAKGNMTLTHQRHFAESYEKITSRYAGDLTCFPNVTALQAQVKAAQKQRAEQLLQLGPRLPELTISAMAQNAVAAEPPPNDPFA